MTRRFGREMSLAAGQRVRVEGLLGAPHLNGKVGVIRRFITGKRRYVIDVEEEEEPSTSAQPPRALAVRPSNLVAVRPALRHTCLINDLPTSVLTQIFTSCPSENLLEHVARCAQVHPEWARIVRSCSAYRLQLQIPGTGDPLATKPCMMLQRLNEAINEIASAGSLRRVLQMDGKKLPKADSEGVVCHVLQMVQGWPIGDVGMDVLSAALRAQAAAGIHVNDINLQNNEITASSSEPLVAAVTSATELKVLLLGGDIISNNPLGEDTCAAVVRALPCCTLEQLHLGRTGCGNEAVFALAAALPEMQQLGSLGLTRNPAIGPAAVAALARALPHARALKTLSLNGCSCRCDGVAALADALPLAPWLRRLDLMDCEIGHCGANRLSRSLFLCCVGVGDRVAVTGLTTQRAVNGTLGVVTEYHEEKGRFAVQRVRSNRGGGGTASPPTTRSILVKAENLTTESRSSGHGLRHLELRGNLFNTMRGGSPPQPPLPPLQPQQEQPAVAAGDGGQQPQQQAEQQQQQEQEQQQQREVDEADRAAVAGIVEVCNVRLIDLK